MKLLIIRSYIFIINLLLVIIKNILFKKVSERNIKSICIYRIGNIGEFFCTLPALYKIRKEYPKAKITLLTSPGSKGLVGGEVILKRGNLVDKIEVYYSEDLKGRNKIDFIKKQRLNKYDYLINFPSEKTSFKVQLRNMLFFKILGIKKADNFEISTVDFFSKYQLSNNNYIPEVERLVELLPFVNDKKIEFPKLLEKKDEIKIKKLFDENNINEKDKLMVVSYAGKGKAKYWTYEKFSKLSKNWIDHGGKVIIIGGKGEYSGAQKIIKNLDYNAYNFCGQTSIFESTHLLTKAEFILTIDTGTAHMASSVDVDCITLFSSYYHRKIWEAYGRRNKIFRKDLDCSPCFDKDCKNKTYRCMKSISVKEIWEYISKKY